MKHYFKVIPELQRFVISLFAMSSGMVTCSGVYRKGLAITNALQRYFASE